MSYPGPLSNDEDSAYYSESTNSDESESSITKGALKFIMRNSHAKKLQFEKVDFENVYEIEDAECKFLGNMLQPNANEEFSQYLCEHGIDPLEELRWLESHFMWRLVHWNDDEHTSKELREGLEDLVSREMLAWWLEPQDIEYFHRYVPDGVQKRCLEAALFACKEREYESTLPENNDSSRSLEREVIDAIRKGTPMESIETGM